MGAVATQKKPSQIRHLPAHEREQFPGKRKRKQQSVAGREESRYKERVRHPFQPLRLEHGVSREKDIVMQENYLTLDNIFI